MTTEEIAPYLESTRDVLLADGRTLHGFLHGTPETGLYHVVPTPGLVVGTSLDDILAGDIASIA
jgi:hypothetical protein